jgi:LPS sulfotransferase NodH
MNVPTRLMELTARSTAGLAPQRAERLVKNPVFFVGSGRSGTNLLAKLLASHPSIAVYPSEANELWHPGAFPWWSSSRATPPIWKDPYTFTAATLSGRTPDQDRRLRAALGSFQALDRGSCVVNKSVMITFMIRHVMSVFPNARFIHLIRDGRAVAVSFARFEQRRIARHPDRYREWNLDLPFETLVEEFARYWRQHICEIEAQRSALGLDGRLIELRYEDLTRTPAQSLEELASFLEVDFERFNRKRWPQIDDRNYKFRETLDDDALERVGSILEPELSKKGYR